MAYEHILLDVSPEGTAVLTLNRPAKRNALNAEVIAELNDAFEMLSKNPECRLVLLRGNGPVFSSGHDLKVCSECTSVCVSIMHEFSALMKLFLSCALE